MELPGDALNKKQIQEVIKGEIPVVWAGNYSIGVNTLNYLTKKAASLLKRNLSEVLEMHHHHKKMLEVVPAERLIEILKHSYEINDSNIVHGRNGQVGARNTKEIGVHALSGDIVGEHTLTFVVMVNDLS